jgi:hypothetical protein
VVQRDPIAVHGTKEWPAPADLRHNRRFTEPELADSLTELGGAGQLPNKACFASRKLAQGQKFGGCVIHGARETHQMRFGFNRRASKTLGNRS